MYSEIDNSVHMLSFFRQINIFNFTR